MFLLSAKPVAQLIDSDALTLLSITLTTIIIYDFRNSTDLSRSLFLCLFPSVLIHRSFDSPLIIYVLKWKIIVSVVGCHEPNEPKHIDSTCNHVYHSIFNWTIRRYMFPCTSQFETKTEHVATIEQPKHENDERIVLCSCCCAWRAAISRFVHFIATKQTERVLLSSITFLRCLITNFRRECSTPSLDACILIQ